ncbi:MAG: endo-1,4-beta-xylanase, partial [Gemmatimonadota bacterium]|nr:endo-1,4-beta-xylanase [Gemmatimonadota bacterium]
QLKKQFNVVTPENAMKWESLRPSRDTFDFAPSDELVDVAATNNQFVHGHTLVWHSQLPEWLTEGTWTKSELRTMLKEHIETVVGHYAGRVQTWDVVNEAMSEEGGTFRETIWSRTGKKKYIKKAFAWARRADPEATLCYNDFNHADMEGWQKEKSDAAYAMVRKLVRQDVPIDCVGFQLHVTSDFEQTAMAENFQRYADLGLQVQVTELDVRIEEPVTEADLAAQARVYREIMDVCLAAPNCTAFIMWGFTDRYSWVPGVFPGWSAATIMTERYKKKPAFTELLEALE